MSQPPPKIARPLLILDVDETLVYASETPLGEREPDFRVGPFEVYRRPHLNAFLSAAAEVFDLAVWSSGSASYVHDIVVALFATPSPLRFVWSSERCTRRYHPDLQEHFYAKNLQKVRKLGYDLERVVMIDDSPEKLSQHYGNHIRVRPFMGDADDTELEDLLPFLMWLQKSENFRRVEKRYWRQFRSADKGGGPGND